jgi:hypothetical protein
VFFSDFENSSSNSDEAENCKVNPSKLLLETMPKDNDASEEEDWDVDAYFSIGNNLCGGHHCGSMLEEQAQDKIQLIRWIEVLKNGRFELCDRDETYGQWTFVCLYRIHDEDISFSHIRELLKLQTLVYRSRSNGSCCLLTPHYATQNGRVLGTR